MGKTSTVMAIETSSGEDHVDQNAGRAKCGDAGVRLEYLVEVLRRTEAGDRELIASEI